MLKTLATINNILNLNLNFHCFNAFLNAQSLNPSISAHPFDGQALELSVKLITTYRCKQDLF